jgi:hypothetical protein
MLEENFTLGAVSSGELFQFFQSFVDSSFEKKRHLDFLFYFERGGRF